MLARQTAWNILPKYFDYIPFIICSKPIKNQSKHWDAMRVFLQYRTKNEPNFLLRISSANVTKSELSIWSHLLKKSLMENFIFCVVQVIPRALLAYPITTWFPVSQEKIQVQISYFDSATTPLIKVPQMFHKSLSKFI